MADDDAALEPVVRDWEPAAALFAGPDGLDAIAEVVAGAAAWLRRGALVLRDRCRTRGRGRRSRAAVGLAAARVERDLAGQDRVLVGGAAR